MAYVKSNIFTEGISGTVGNAMTFYIRKGRTVVTVKRGRNTNPPTEAQQEANKRFVMASLFAQGAIKDPAIKTLYEKAAKGGQTAYNLAVKDAMSPPVIAMVYIRDYKGSVGNVITIKARDVIAPKSVTVVIFSPTGTVLEQGDAVIKTNDSRFWIYTVTTANAALTGARVVVTAMDWPGNKTEQTITIS